MHLLGTARRSEDGLGGAWQGLDRARLGGARRRLGAARSGKAGCREIGYGLSLCAVACPLTRLGMVWQGEARRGVVRLGEGFTLT